MFSYKDRSFCADHEQCATMQCKHRLTSRDQEYLINYHYIPVAYMSMRDQCGKWKEVEPKMIYLPTMSPEELRAYREKTKDMVMTWPFNKGE